jgi:DNA invertase Pin-like site-specific DNA recombinase
MTDATAAPPRRGRVRHQRERTESPDLATLGYQPRMWSVIAVSTDDQDASLENQPERLEKACRAASRRDGGPWRVAGIAEHTGSRSDWAQKDNPIVQQLRDVTAKGLAEIIGAREVSRITRVEPDGIELLNMWRDKGIYVHLYLHRRLFDPTDQADYKALKQMFAEGHEETALLRERVILGIDDAREEGRLVGRTPYGYVVYKDGALRHPPMPRRIVAVSCTRQGCKWWYNGIPADANGNAVTQCPSCREPTSELQAWVVREIIAWAGEGLSLSAITTKLNKRGTPAPTRVGRYGIDDQGRPLKAEKGPDGKPTGRLVPVSKYGRWSTETVLGIATNPAYIGRICADVPVTHGGESFGGPRDRDLGKTIEAPAHLYPRIIEDDQDFWRAANRLALRGQVKGARQADPEFAADLAGVHVHQWEQVSGNETEGRRFACVAEVPEGQEPCRRVRVDRPGAARHDATHIAVCALHRSPIEPGNKAEVAPKDVPLNAMRDLWAACGDELAAIGRRDGRWNSQEQAGAVGRVLRAVIADGRLAPGTRLPSSRALATKLGMSRAVVSLAYGELAAGGVLAARPQSGVFVPGGSPDGGSPTYTGRYKRYYRCSSHKDVNVPEDEADEEIARQVAEHLGRLWEAGGFERRITDERHRVQSELEEARQLYDELDDSIRRATVAGNKAYRDLLGGQLGEQAEKIKQLEVLERTTAVPDCLRIFAECDGDTECMRRRYLGLDTARRRVVLGELTREIVMYPARNRGRGHNDIADRVRVTQWAPWYVADSDQGRAADEGAVRPVAVSEVIRADDGGERITDAATGQVIYPRPQDGEAVAAGEEG